MTGISSDKISGRSPRQSSEPGPGPCRYIDIADDSIIYYGERFRLPKPSTTAKRCLIIVSRQARLCETAHDLETLKSSCLMFPTTPTVHKRQPCPEVHAYHLQYFVSTFQTQSIKEVARPCIFNRRLIPHWYRSMLVFEIEPRNLFLGTNVMSTGWECLCS